ncbi:hypothetical protein M1555_00045 [Patescibacteria group bacterium]|nr:hypothetical protein [Patescibacteria group bacterium]
MREKQRTLAAVTIIAGFIILIVIVVGSLLSGGKIVSPVPEDTATIRVIFLTPTPAASPVASPSAQPNSTRPLTTPTPST